MKNKNEVTTGKLDLNSVMRIAQESEEQVRRGVNKKTASTGKLMSELKGAAKKTALLSNIGGGSKAKGGKGMDGGFDCIRRMDKSKAILETIDVANKNKLIKDEKS